MGRYKKRSVESKKKQRKRQKDKKKIAIKNCGGEVPVGCIAIYSTIYLLTGSHPILQSINSPPSRCIGSSTFGSPGSPPPTPTSSCSMFGCPASPPAPPRPPGSSYHSSPPSLPTTDFINNFQRCVEEQDAELLSRIDTFPLREIHSTDGDI
jgi:hypothetical protein